jgi:hypothetical protein
MGIGARNDIETLLERIHKLSIGIITDDFSRLHDLLSHFQDMDLKPTVIDPEKGTHIVLDCIIVDDPERKILERIDSERIVEMMDDPEGSIQRAIAASLGLLKPFRLIIGIDPGKRPGAAFLADGRLATIYKSPTPGMINDRILMMIESLMPETVVVRLGNGDPVNRDRIMDGLIARNLHIEMVDESMTTTERKFRDETSAVAIAMTGGIPIEEANS